MTGKPSQECVCSRPERDRAQHGDLVLECSHCDPSYGLCRHEMEITRMEKIMQKQKQSSRGKIMEVVEGLR
jgi:hypothetical protein